MYYEKPQLVPLDSAISTIQHSCKDCTHVDGNELITTNAYEADE
jgi:hypothetical protein